MTRLVRVTRSPVVAPGVVFEAAPRHCSAEMTRAFARLASGREAPRERSVVPPIEVHMVRLRRRRG